jgi:NAD+ kinase
LLEEIAQYLAGEGLDVSLERATAQATGVTGFDASTGRPRPHCDLAVVVGGDGTMLGIARELARLRPAAGGHQPGAPGLHHRHPVGQYREALAR